MGVRHIPKLISKTKIMAGYQCHKNLYWAVHNKELIPPVTPELQALFDQGNRITELARKLYPEGLLVDFPAYDFVGSLQKTRELLKANTETIFEAAFEYKGCYARADIIRYNPLNQRWSVTEVKMSTKIKDEHIDDVGLQVWIMANAGLPIEKISVMYLNNLYRHETSEMKEGQYSLNQLKKLFVEEDVTERLRQNYKSISTRLTDMFKALRSDKAPEVEIGPQCLTPRVCQFKDHCWGELRLPEPNIFHLPALGNKKWTQAKWELYRKGHVGLSQLDESDRAEILNPQQARPLESLISRKRFVDQAKIKAELSGWKFPLVFLDFETINPAVPRYEGTAPFSQVPFQYSVHVMPAIDSPDHEITHLEFLADDVTDPRPELIPKLIEACQGEGSVVAYFAQFEGERLQEMADYFPAHQEALLQIRSRLVDPLPVLRESVYDPEFGDSFSIKSVGPALLGDRFDYSKLKVSDGGAAQRAFEEMISPNTSPMRKNELKMALLRYCEQDTFVMVELVRWLFQQI